ncbi:hypothetical protein [Blastomonas sp.]|uniref:hypothetical protein n=1 Tax=Blastomonas sp. TaxID=1909299 RepID=UPI003593DA7A
MRRLKAIFTSSEQEYQAALNGLSIFFGAILGVALGGVEDLEPLAYITLLVMVSGIVLGILYIPASRHRLVYAVGLIALLTVLMITHEPGDMILHIFPLPSKLVPTLIV